MSNPRPNASKSNSNFKQELMHFMKEETLKVLTNGLTTLQELIPLSTKMEVIRVNLNSISVHQDNIDQTMDKLDISKINLAEALKFLEDVKKPLATASLLLLGAKKDLDTVKKGLQNVDVKNPDFVKYSTRVKELEEYRKGLDDIYNILESNKTTQVGSIKKVREYIDIQLKNPPAKPAPAGFRNK